MNISTTLQSLPAGVLVGLGALLVVQIVLDVIAFVDLARRPVDRLALIQNKWVWAAIILVINTIGAILYLAIGRKRTAPAVDTRPAVSAGTRASDAANLLYGERKDADGR
jgi:heme/copper-type cytochrome/quinol oxidase subunit 4